MLNLKARFWKFYNDKIVAGWWRSTAMWAGILAGALPFILDGLQLVLDNWPIASQAVTFDSLTTMRMQLGLAVLVPILRAWRQKSMEKAAIKQASEAGKVVPLPASGVSPVDNDYDRTA